MFYSLAGLLEKGSTWMHILNMTATVCLHPMLASLIKLGPNTLVKTGAWRSSSKDLLKHFYKGEKHRSR